MGWRYWIWCFTLSCLLLSSTLPSSYATTYYMPQFTSLPPPLVYISRDDTQSRLTCVAWPSENMTVSMFMANINVKDPNPILFPLPSNWKTASEGPGQMTLLVSGSSMLEALRTKRLHCLATNALGALISRPFQVVEPYLNSYFPPVSSSSQNINGEIQLMFLLGNVAVLDCPAPGSHPPAMLKFSHNSAIIEAVSNRYRYIQWPENNGVSLLIADLKLTDKGTYACEATNPVTLKKFMSTWVYNLDVKMPQGNVEPRIRRHLYGSDTQIQLSQSSVAAGGFQSDPTRPEHVITLREGQNASLFCVMEGAPPPSLTVFPSTNSLTPPESGAGPRVLQDDEFGIRHIRNVKVSDAGNYVCSPIRAPSVSSTATVKVIQRLTISDPPKNIPIRALDELSVRFSCFVPPATMNPMSDVLKPSRRVVWYRNGRIVSQHNSQDGSLVIERVMKENLGVYQCVAMGEDEWVSRHAILYLKDDKILTKDEVDKMQPPPEILPSPTPKQDTPNRVGRDGEPREEVRLLKPRTATLFINVGVVLSWKVDPSSFPSGEIEDTGGMFSYRVQMQQAMLERNGVVDESTLRWRDPLDILSRVKIQPVFIREPLEAGNVYRFRVVREVPSQPATRIESPWSNPVSFAHVGATPPRITHHEKLNGEKLLRVYWIYPKMEQFPVTHFAILTRKAMAPAAASSSGRSRRSASGDSGERKKRRKTDANPYMNNTVPAQLDRNNSQSADIEMKENGNFEIVILGQSWDTQLNMLRFTVMSPPLLVNISALVPIPPNNTLESHMYMIYIVSIAGAATTIIILILLILCAFHSCMEKKQARQRREDWLMNSSAVTNSGHACSTMPPIYKDPAKLLHRENSLLLRYATTPPAGAEHPLEPNGHLHSGSAAAAAASLLHYPHNDSGGQANASSFMLASLTSQSQQVPQSHYQAGSYSSSRFQSLQRGAGAGAGGGYQMTPGGMAMMKREPPSGGDSVNDNLDGSGYPSQQQQTQGGTLYHRGGPMSNSLAGSRLLLPHANSPPLASTPMMAQAMSLQALHLTPGGNGNPRDSVHLPQTTYLSSTTARSQQPPLSPLSPNTPSQQQQQWLAWQQQQQQQALAAAAMMGYATNTGGQTPNTSSTATPVSPMDMYYAAAAAHALRMQQAAAIQQQAVAATLRQQQQQQHHHGDGNESVYSYFSQPTHPLHHTLDGNSPSTPGNSAFFPQHPLMMMQHQQQQQQQQQQQVGVRPGSVQPPPTLQEQEEDQQHQQQTVGNADMLANGNGGVTGRPPSSAASAGNHHHHHRRRRRKQPSGGGPGSSQVLPPSQGHLGLNKQGSEDNGDLGDDGQGGMDGEDTPSTPDPHRDGPNTMQPPLPVQNRPPPSYQDVAKYVNHGSFPPPVAKFPGAPGASAMYQSHGQHNPHPLYQNSLTRRGTPTLLVEPPRMRDYSEYGIPPNQVAAATSAAPSDVEDLGTAGGRGGHPEEMPGSRLSSSYLPPPPPRV